MKKFLTTFGLLISVALFASVSDSSLVISALKEGDAEKFARCFDDYVDIKLPQKDELKNVSKTQAAITIKSFFQDNNISGFELLSQRPLGGSMYITGKLLSGGQSYSITLMLKNKGDTTSVITIRIT